MVIMVIMVVIVIRCDSRASAHLSLNLRVDSFRVKASICIRLAFEIGKTPHHASEIVDRCPAVTHHRKAAKHLVEGTHQPSECAERNPPIWVFCKQERSD